MSKYMVWECKIVIKDEESYLLPDGADSPPRRAAINAVEKFGCNIVACFSGWSNKLTKIEEEFIKCKENKKQ